MRLDKVLQDLGYSKRAIKKLIQKERLRINHIVIKESNINIDGNIHELRIDQSIVSIPRHIYLMLNKPQGYITAVKDNTSLTVIDLITSDLRDDLVPVGRLDKNSEGLLILTNNGIMTYCLTGNNFEIDKKYYVQVNGLISQKHVEDFKNGITFLDGVICKPAKLQIVASSELESIAIVTLREGKFHQIKKMFLCLGLKVTYLQRIEMGGLTLDNCLKIGEYRSLTSLEIKELYKSLDHEEKKKCK